MIYVALGTALLAVASQFAFSLGPVPITLQTLAVGLLATLFRPRETFLSLLLYILIGAIGLPVFAAGASGFGVIFGPTGGYILGFLVSGPLISFLLQKFNRSIVASLLANLVGFSLTLTIGTIWLRYAAKMNWQAAFTSGFLGFILIELGKAVVVAFVAVALQRALAKTSRYFA